MTIAHEQARDGKPQDQRKVVDCILFSMEPVVEADVEAEKNIHEHDGGGREVIKLPWEGIAWLNARERSGNPWPHDEAYCYNPGQKLFLRIHRIVGLKPVNEGNRNNNGNNNNNDNNNSNNAPAPAALTAALASVSDHTATIAAQRAQIHAQSSTIAAQGERLEEQAKVLEQTRGQVADQERTMSDMGKMIELQGQELANLTGTQALLLDKLSQVIGAKVGETTTKTTATTLGE